MAADTGVEMWPPKPEIIISGTVTLTDKIERPGSFLPPSAPDVRINRSASTRSNSRSFYYVYQWTALSKLLAQNFLV